MTLDDVRLMLASIDPNIRHGWTMGNGEAYTWWEEGRRVSLMADDRHVERGWAFYVHRFYLTDTDPVTEALFDTLDSLPNVTVTQENTVEEDTGYTHVIFACEVV